MSLRERRVVITGVAGISPLGNDWHSIYAQLRACHNAVQRIDAWDVYDGLNTKLAAPAAAFELPVHYNRKTTRSMGRVALMAVRASELALADAGLLGDPILTSGKVGVSNGSSAGTHSAMGDFGRMLNEHTTAGINATTYI